MTALAFTVLSLASFGASTPRSSMAVSAYPVPGLPVPQALKDKPVPPLLFELDDVSPTDSSWPRPTLGAALPNSTSAQRSRGCTAAAGIVLGGDDPWVGSAGIIDVTFALSTDGPAARCGLTQSVRDAVRR